jgi:hypothetical protein
MIKKRDSLYFFRMKKKRDSLYFFRMKKKRDKIGGWYAGGGKGVTSFAAHPFLRLINYKLIKLSLLVSSFP